MSHTLRPTTVAPDSDESEADDFVQPTLSAATAVSHIRELREYAVALPAQFTPATVRGLDERLSAMTAMSLQSKKQATLQGLWQA